MSEVTNFILIKRHLHQEQKECIDASV